jgi:hypothetical protein
MGKEAKNNGRKVAKKARIPTISGFKKFVRETFPSHSYEINKDATIVKEKDGRFRRIYKEYKYFEFLSRYIQSLK